MKLIIGRLRAMCMKTKHEALAGKEIITGSELEDMKEKA